MAVLVQEVIPAEYAYVVHTVNPKNQNKDEVYVESCLGLGESLVAGMSGQGLSFSYDKNSKETSVHAYPNKPISLHSSGFIFRSDSNSEDLSGFAGAGLFDSYTMTEAERPVVGSRDPAGFTIVDVAAWGSLAHMISAGEILGQHAKGFF